MIVESIWKDLWPLGYIQYGVAYDWAVLNPCQTAVC